MKIYTSPRARGVARADGLYLDLRGRGEVGLSEVVEMIASLGASPSDRGFEILALVDPSKPPRGLETVSRLWSLVPVIDLALVGDVEILSLFQRAFQRIGVRMLEDHLQASISLIALTLPDLTLVPRRASAHLRSLKLFTGASSGSLIMEVEDLEEEIPGEVGPLIEGVAVTGPGEEGAAEARGL